MINYRDTSSNELLPEQSQLLDAFLAKVRFSGMRATPKRVRILTALLKMDRPASVSDIRDLVGNPSPDLVTVYRALEAFEQISLVRRVVFEDGTYFFQVARGSTPTPRLICRKCHFTEFLPATLPQQLEQHAVERGFVQVVPKFEIYGLCHDCQHDDPPQQTSQL